MPTTSVTRVAPRCGAPVPERVDGTRVRADAVQQRRRGRVLLDDVSLEVPPGGLLAVAGPSGAGKTTLLEVLAGVARPHAGDALHDGVPADATRRDVGYVPQDDVVHRELPLRRSLWYTARLRLPSASTPSEVDARVDEVLRLLGLADRADVVVGELSGGQRKRASIAAELLTRPRALFLDEPTSGLDPAAAADLLDALHDLAALGVTVVLTTHAPADLERCGQVALLSDGGRLAYVGPPEGAPRAFGASGLVEVYRALGRRDLPGTTRTGRAAPPVPPDPSADGGPPASVPAPLGPVGQWALLTRRSVETIVRRRVTAAVLLGSPVLVIAMMAVLFRRDGFLAPGTSGVGPAQIVFWIAFAGFFFGLVDGLLQVVVEMPLVRREHLAGIDARAYVAAKLTVLLPLLVAVVVTLLGVLRLTGRLPASGWEVDAALLGVLVLESACALAIGLFASALVADALQAVLVLPMVCFPQVLFAGAVVPVADMTPVGRSISAAMATRWTFESAGRVLAGSGATPRAVGPYDGAWSGHVASGCAVLAALTVLFTMATVVALRVRCSRR